MTVDLHQLQLPFTRLRIAAPKAVDALARSIDERGQLVAVVVVDEDERSWNVIDGYRRIAALERCGHDQAWVERWDCPLEEALLRVLAQAQARPWQALEEAALLQELIERYGCSQRQIARQSGRDASWINRRLALLEGLPETALAAVRAGQLSSWAASRVLLPLARANTEHANTLLQQLGEQPLSTRELALWFQHYQRANRTTRIRLVEQPQLFLKAWRTQQAQRQAQQLQSGPEGQWLRDLRHIERLAQGLSTRVCTVFDPAQARSARQHYYDVFVAARASWRELEATLHKAYSDDR